MIVIDDVVVVGRWFFVLLALFGLGIPIASVVFASLPGRGAGFALPTSLTILGFLVFWTGHVRFSGATVVIVVALLAIATLVVLSRDVAIDRHAAFESLCLFTIAFAGIALVLSLNPSLLPRHEHFLNHSILQSLLRGETLPPEDPWFAGKSVQYHYGGPLLSAILVELSGVDPRYGHNLAVATFYALLVTSAFELAGSIAAVHDRSRRLGGLLGAFFVGVASNLFVPLVIVTSGFSNRIAEPFVAVFAPHLTWARAEVLWSGLSEFRYDDPKFLMEEGLTAVPLLEAFHSELHAHFSSAPFLVFIVALLYAYYRTPPNDRKRRWALLFVAFPIAVGTTAVIDVWTLPTVLGLCWLVVMVDPLETDIAARLYGWKRLETGKRLPTELSRVLGATVVVGAIGALTAAGTAPFFSTIGGSSGTISLVSAEQRTTGPQFVLLYGAFVIITVGYFVVSDRIGSPPEGERSTDGDGNVHRPRTVTIPVLERVTDRYRLALAGTVVLALVLWITIDLAAGIVFGPLLVLAWWGTRETDDFVMILLVAVSGILLAIEFVYFDDPDPIVFGRTNTLFRAYFQTWVLWGIVSGVLSLRLLPRGRLPSREWITDTGTTLVVILVVVTSLYGVVALGQFVHGSTSPPDEDGYYRYEPPGLAVSEVHDTRTYRGADLDTTLSSAVIDDEIVASGTESRVWSGPYTWLYPGVYEISAVVNANATGESGRVGTIVVEGRAPHESERTRFETIQIDETGGYERVSTTVRIDRPQENVVVAGDLEDENATVRLESVSIAYLETLDGRSTVEVVDDQPTLDGHLYAEALHPAEMDAIAWLDEHVDGQPTLASAPGGRWRWDSPASSLTGIPTVVGWEHELVYRSDTTYYERTRDVDTLYRGTPTERVDVIERYGVQYVYAGPLERDRYGEFRSFTELDGVSVAYRNDAVTIYDVEHDELAAEGSTGSEASDGLSAPGNERRA